MWAQLLWEADPRAWQSGHVKTVFGYPEDAKMLPFMRVLGQKLGIDLGSLRNSGSVYMRFTADAVDIDDLRLAYGKIMSEMEIEASSPLDEQHEPVPQPPKPGGYSSPPRMSLLRFEPRSLAFLDINATCQDPPCFSPQRVVPFFSLFYLSSVFVQ